MYIGFWSIDALLTFDANTHRFDTGVATDADSPPTYRVYEDETATPILTGTMALLDSANTAGFYSEQITLSAANGFEQGKRYTIYITGAVNSVTATTTRSFQIETIETLAAMAAEVRTELTPELAHIVTMASGVTVTTNNDKTGYGLSAAAVQAIWDALTSALTTVGSIGKLLVDNINATIASRLASSSYTAPPTAIENADAVLVRASSAIEGSAPAKSLGGAVIRSSHKVQPKSGDPNILEVLNAAGDAVLYEVPITTDPNLEPIASIGPAATP